MNTRQYATVTIPANHPCERAVDRQPQRWPIPMTVRVHRAVVTNKSKGSYRAETSRWFFIHGPYMYSFEPWEGFTPKDERFAQRDFVLKGAAL